MKTKIEVTLEPFKIPAYVVVVPDSTVGNVSQVEARVQLKNLDVTTLRGLCDEFRVGVFKAANNASDALPVAVEKKPDSVKLRAWLQDYTDYLYVRHTRDSLAALREVRTYIERNL